MKGITNMKGLRAKLLEEQNRLEAIISFQKSQLKDATEGSLRLSKSHGKLQYYHRTEKNKNGKYIGQDNQQLIRELAQKKYDERILRLAEKRAEQIKKITKDYEDNEIEKVYLNEHPERQKLIKPIEPTWEERLILTYETEQTILNTGKIEQLVKRYLTK